MSENISSLQELLDELEGAGEGDEVTIREVHEAVGRRSFGPALLIPGLLGASPLSGIPGTPSIVGILTLLITGQLLIGREEFWLPGFLLRRSVSRERFEKTIQKVGPAARVVDRVVKPRLEMFVGRTAVYVIAGLCLLLALTAPVLEALPFAITGVGAALAAFGLALVANDGVLALVALLLCVGTGGAIVVGLG